MTMNKKKVKFMCTAFRDGFQSVFGARVFTKDFLPAVEAARAAGIDYFEAGGGARFQSLYFYSNEDAFQMMDSFRLAAGPDAELQTLARGVNVVGLESQPGDVIKLHAQLFKKHGITSIRNFDALNDVNNLIYSGQCIHEAGLKHQVCVTLMELPPGCTGAHDADFYIDTLKKILDADIPYDSVCFKDASGTAVPSKVYETIKRARKLLGEDAFIHYHTHETAGISIVSNKAALDAGATAIDLSMAPCSGGTCQPDILAMWHSLRGTEYDLGVDVNKIREAEEVFKECMKDYFMPPEATAVEPMIPWSPMPGGALTSNTQMLRDNNIMDKYPEIIKAMGEVVEKGGFGTSVTPVSQFYFQQAFNNVMFGPWEKIAPSYGKMVLGYFGKTPVPPHPEIIELAKKQLDMEPTTRPPIEINNEDPTKGLEVARKIIKEEGFEETEENLFIVAACKEKGVTYLKGEAEIGVRKKKKEEDKPVAAKSSNFVVSVNGKDYNMSFQDNMAIVNGKTFNVDIRDAGAAAAANTPAVESAQQIPVKAPMPGKVFRILAEPGDAAVHGQPILILEAMKMETKIMAPEDGVVAEVLVKIGDQVNTGDLLAYIE
jgi:pyruvate carboxylase subunit B